MKIKSKQMLLMLGFFSYMRPFGILAPDGLFVVHAPVLYRKQNSKDLRLSQAWKS